jgi:Domain of unknown function (DUF4123)
VQYEQLDPLERILNADHERLYALVDAARDSKLVEQMRSAKIAHYSLFSGVKEVTLARVAPYLVPVTALLPYLRRFATRAWGKSWSVIVESDATLEEVRLQLKKSILVNVADGQTGYFRFYDSRAFEKFFSVGQLEQMQYFMGDCLYKWYWMSSSQSQLHCLESCPSNDQFGLMVANKFKLSEMPLRPIIKIESKTMKHDKNFSTTDW